VAFAATLTDAMLAAALSHEREHVRALDPLRYLLLELALHVNPVGRWLLTTHAARWTDAREAHCDREAVLGGAEPLPLAQALLKAARPGPVLVPALAPNSLAVLKLRVSLLLAFAERHPRRHCRDGQATIPIAFALLLIAMLLPHQTGTQALDALHVSIERVFTSAWH
jgi:beta-lactamase regulating signal transducer with metallopeptidase domain